MSDGYSKQWPLDRVATLRRQMSFACWVDGARFVYGREAKAVRRGRRKHAARVARGKYSDVT